MKIAIVGVGAMGGVYAGLFAEAGHEVWAVDVWPEHVAAINEGMRLEGFSGDRIITGIRATTDPAEVGPCDLVVLATKAAGVGPAAAAMAPMLGPETPVLTIQNGMGAGERLSAVMEPGRILLGIAQAFGASVKGPGHIHHNNMNLIRVGELGGGETERLASIVDLWRGAGFTAEGYDDTDQMIWEKFICNVSFSAPCTVFNRTIGEMMEDPGTRAFSLGCGTEAFNVARALGVNLTFDDPVPYLEAFAAKLLQGRPSMLLDHLAGRRSEIDALNGFVPVKGAEIGIPTPMNETATAIVRAREAAF
ncbi:2-dehydropantoate 2-reductase [Rhodobacteraceae bacterium NNCM2]|nr:2-dehydropantoate 2-reductase [Coraliihabitans acroporae]